MKPEEKVAYAAGLFDGEGYVGIDKNGRNPNSKSPHYSIRVIISQKDGLVMDWLKENFGGNVYSQRNGTEYYIYRWRIHALSAVNFLKVILPYLIIKKKQVEFALCFMEAKKIKLADRFGTDGRFKKTSDANIEWIVEQKAILSQLKREYNPSTMNTGKDNFKQ